MKKYAFIFCFTLLLTKCTFCHDYAASIKINADSMITAFLHGDVNRLLDFTYPRLFDIIGDRTFMAEYTSQALLAMQADGFTLDTATVGTPGPVFHAGTELHALVNQTVYSSFPGGTIKSDSPLLAISQDGGSKWYFLDMKSLSPDMIRVIFPDFNYDLVIPAVPPPVITYNEGFIKED